MPMEVVTVDNVEGRPYVSLLLGSKKYGEDILAKCRMFIAGLICLRRCNRGHH